MTCSMGRPRAIALPWILTIIPFKTGGRLRTHEEPTRFKHPRQVRPTDVYYNALYPVSSLTHMENACSCIYIYTPFSLHILLFSVDDDGKFDTGNARARLQRPIYDDRIFFAGEGLSFDMGATVPGAVFEGERVGNAGESFVLFA